MKYYLLSYDIRHTDAVLSEPPDLPPPFDLWNKGRRFEESVPEPLEYSIDEEDSGMMPPLFDTGAHLLLRKDLAGTLRDAGVSNLDTYSAIIHDRKDGNSSFDYVATNIVGVISAADPSRSTGEDLGLVNNGLMTMWFDDLVISGDRARHALMFRLAEKLSYIVVNERVKNHLQANGFGVLSFLEVGSD